MITTQRWIYRKHKQTNKQHWEQSSTVLDTQAISSFPFSPTASPRNAWKFWNLFDELTICHGILHRKHENFTTGQMVFKQVVPPKLAQNKIHFLHCDHTSAHTRVTKIFKKVRSRFFWFADKRDLEVFVASCFVCQKATVPQRNIFIVHENGSPAFHFQLSLLISWAHFRVPSTINTSFR